MALDNAIKTRYLVIRLDINDENSGVFANGTTTKYIYAYSGAPLVTESIYIPSSNPDDTTSKPIVAFDNIAYQKVDCVIQASIGYQNNVATVIIYGMDDSDINTFTRTNLTGQLDLYTNNTISIYAGYTLGSDGLPSLVYTGGILRAGADYNMSRDRPFIINSLQYFVTKNVNLPPINIKGKISLDNLFRYIADAVGFRYVGINITGDAYNPILTGSLFSMLDDITKKYGYTYYISQDGVPGQNVIFISPSNEPFDDYASSSVTYAINIQENNMIGFPVVTDYGFSVMSYFNPQLTIGRSVTVTSLTVPYINNRALYVNQMVHELSNRSANWKTTMQLNIWSSSRTG